MSPGLIEPSVFSHRRPWEWNQPARSSGFQLPERSWRRRPVADLSVLVRRIRGVRVVPAGEDHAHQGRGGDRVRGGATGMHVRARQRRGTRRVRHQGASGVDEGLGPGHDVVGGSTVRGGTRGSGEPLRHGPLTVGQHDRDGAQRALGTRALHVVGQATAIAGRLVTEGGQGAGSPAGLRHLSDRIKCAAGGRLGRHRSHHGEAQRGRQHHRAGEADQPRARRRTVFFTVTNSPSTSPAGRGHPPATYTCYLNVTYATPTTLERGYVAVLGGP